MSRLPCSACGGETLIAVIESNGGLCARCAKGESPCAICGQRVWGPLPGGLYIHHDCQEKALAKKRKLDWKSDADIDWEIVRQIYRRKLESFIGYIASGKATIPEEAPLIFYTEFNGGWCFNIHRKLADGNLENYDGAIAGWYDDPEGYDSAFAILDHDMEDMDAAERIGARFLSILAEEVEKLVGTNFGFPPSTRVTWHVSDG